MDALAPETQPETELSLEALLDWRHSCRGFLPTSVDKATIERIVGLAQKTASWCNSQAWQTIIVSGAGTDRFREALFAWCGSHPPSPDFEWPRYEGVYLERRRECGFQLFESCGIPRGDRVASAEQSLQNYRLFGAPHVAMVTVPKSLGVYGAVDGGGYVGTFMLAAASLGVATIPQAALATHPDFIRSYFGLPEERLVLCGISFGYEDKQHRANGFRTRRAAVSEAIAWVDA
jgi:nitroreductase